ncbi:hypothetical protein ABE79_18585, partial [Proteus mirabilis]
AYKKQNYSSRFTWDTKLSWQPEFAYGVGVSVEVNNVLNTKTLPITSLIKITITNLMNQAVSSGYKSATTIKN